MNCNSTYLTGNTLVDMTIVLMAGICLGLFIIKSF